MDWNDITNSATGSNWLNIFSSNGASEHCNTNDPRSIPIASIVVAENIALGANHRSKLKPLKHSSIVVIIDAPPDVQIK